MGKKLKGQLIKKPIIPNDSLEEIVGRQISKSDLESDTCLKISFKHLDKNQGKCHKQLHQEGLLLNAIETLSSYCSMRLNEAVGSKFTIYGSFPPKNKTEFKNPTHVPPDANWASMHANGVFCIAGHIVKDVFYIVFYDIGHKFWKSTKKHT